MRKQIEQGITLSNLISISTDSIYFMKGMVSVNRFTREKNLPEQNKLKLYEQMKNYRMVPTASGKKVSESPQKN